MSQYTISIKSIIDIENEHVDKILFPNIEQRINIGRRIFFSLDYGVTDENFKTLFENGFLIANLDENICYDDVDKWIFKFHNDLKIKAPLYYKKYKAIESLTESVLTEIGGTKTTIENESSAEGSTKSLSSRFPKQIKEGQFSDVRYMDSGSTSESESSGKNSGVQITENTGNALDRVNDYVEIQKNIIQELIDSFNNLFIALW